MTKINSKTSTLAHENSAAICPRLIAAAKENDSSALFQLGLITLRQHKVGFAKIFFESAASFGHVLAKQYVDAYTVVNHNLTAWQQYILADQNK